MKNPVAEDEQSMTEAECARTSGEAAGAGSRRCGEGTPRQRQCSANSSCGGPVGRGRVRGREGRPRIFAATSCEVMSARTRRRPPQGQSKTSNPQVRRSNWAQSSLGRTGGFRGTAPVAGSFSWVPVGAGSGSGWGGSGGRGTTCLRHFELGARQPKNLVKWTLGFITSGHRRLINWSGVSTSTVAPLGAGFLRRYSSLPSSRRVSRLRQTGPRAPYLQRRSSASLSF